MEGVLTVAASSVPNALVARFNSYSAHDGRLAATGNGLVSQTGVPAKP
jgi:hypothetical protein